MDRTLEIQICSVELESDIESEKLREQYLRGNYTELRKVRTQKKIKRVVAVEVQGDLVQVEFVEWKPSHIPGPTLLSEYQEVCEDVATEQQYSTVSPRLQHKLHRLEELILARL